MKYNIYFLIRSLLISLLFFLLLPFHSFAYHPQDPYCPNNCSHNGGCQKNHECICIDGWTGIDCSINLSNSCRNNCSNHGSCNSDGSCSCDPNWFGSDCSISCPTNCLVHGFCDGAGGCICDTGWSGSDCSINLNTSCTDNCSGHGTCNSDGKCSCDTGWSGSGCSVPSNTSCPNNCSGNGFCSSSLMGCSCDVGWTGSDCSINLITSCPNDCSGNGVCSDDGCHCNLAWSGSDCSDFAFASDKETRQAIKDNIQNVANLDNQVLQKIKEEDYSSLIPMINNAVKSLIDIKDSINYVDNFDINVEFKIRRLMELSIKNHEKASSNIDRIVNDPKVQEDEGLLSGLLKGAKRFINNALRNNRRAQQMVLAVRG